MRVRVRSISFKRVALRFETDRVLERAGFELLAGSELLSMQDKDIDECLLTKCLWQFNMVLENEPLGASKVVPYKVPYK